MRITTALKVRDRGREAIRSIFSSAAHFGTPHSVMLERRKEAFERIGVLKAPTWVRHYLNGIWDQCQQQAYANDLVFGGMIDGKFYSTHSDRDDYYEKHGFEPRDYLRQTDLQVDVRFSRSS